MKIIDSIDNAPRKNTGRVKWWGLAVLIAAALLFRLLYFNQVKDTVVFHGYKMDHLDMGFFLSWAVMISNGDILSDQINHPYHLWHKRFGSQAEWVRWYGGARLHQSPLYPYLLAGFYSAGLSITEVKIIQALAGVLIIALIYLLARLLISTRAAFIAALLALCYGPFYLYETQLLRTTWITLAGISSIYLCLRAQNGRSDWWWIGVGLLSGLLFLLKAGFLLWFLLVLVWVGFVVERKKTLIRVYLLIILPFALCLTPLAWRNYQVGAPLLSSSSVGAATFTFGSAADVSGVKFETSRFTRQIMLESGGGFWPTVISTLKTHHRGFPSIAVQIGRKILAFSQGYETPNNADYYYAQLHSSFLKWGTFTFSVVGPLGLLGIFLSLKKGRKFLLLYFYLGCVLAQIILFYYISRFRLPAVAVMIIFAGGAGDLIIGLLRRKDKTRGLAVALVVLLLYLALSPPWVPARRISCDDFLTVAGFYALQGDYSIAGRELDIAEKVYPKEMERINKIRAEVRQMELTQSGLRRGPDSNW